MSENLPLVDTEQLPRWNGLAVGAVDDARPDRWGERVIRFLDRPARLSLMEYLYYAGDARFGALGVSTSSEQYLPREVGPLPQLGSAQALSEIAQKIIEKEPVSEAERRLMSAGGSLGGAKPKALIEVNGEAWMLKFFHGEPVDVPLVEHASMTLARQAGIHVATTQVVSLARENALAVRRFDRQGPHRVHCISAGTALRAETIAGREPVFGYPQLAQLLRRIGVTQDGQHEKDRTELFRRMVFNILMDNTDDHEKNHALCGVSVAGQHRFRLSPAYDVLPTQSGQGRQEFVVGVDQGASTLENAMSQCEWFGLSRQAAAGEVLSVIQVVDTWKMHFKSQGVTDADIDALAEHIDGPTLLAQRRAFQAERWASPAVGRVRKGPFAR